jgi:hypothetical protein
MDAIRSAGVICLLTLAFAGCGNDEDDDTCPEPAQSIVGPSVRPDLSSVPVCKLPEQPQ